MNNDTKIVHYERLINNPDFSVFLDEYLNQDVLDIVENYNLDLPDSIDELKARQKFKRYIRDIIDTLEIKKDK